MEAVSVSLGSLCEAVDGIGDGSTTMYDCCSNPDNGQTRCQERSFAAAVGSLTTPGALGVCKTDDAACNT